MNAKKRDFRDLYAGLVTMATAAFLFFSTFGTKSFTTGSIKADTIPKIVAVVMFVLGVLTIVKWLREKPVKEVEAKAPEADESAAEETVKERFKKITTPVTLALIFLYILIMDKVGFVISTFLYLTAQITLLSTDLSKKSFLKSALIAVIASVLIFLIFGKAFKLALPVNNFGF